MPYPVLYNSHEHSRVGTRWKGDCLIDSIPHSAGRRFHATGLLARPGWPVVWQRRSHMASAAAAAAATAITTAATTVAATATAAITTTPAPQPAPSTWHANCDARELRASMAHNRRSGASLQLERNIGWSRSVARPAVGRRDARRICDCSAPLRRTGTTSRAQRPIEPSSCTTRPPHDNTRLRAARVRQPPPTEVPPALAQLPPWRLSVLWRCFCCCQVRDGARGRLYSFLHVGCWRPALGPSAACNSSRDI
jgi:hypothetical protein